ncbi:27141_t:CDS:2, partial [Gigaspora margarita]
IDKLVEEQIASRKKQSLASEKRFFEAKSKQVSQPGSVKKKVDQIHINHFFDELLKENSDPNPSGFHDN